MNLVKILNFKNKLRTFGERLVDDKKTDIKTPNKEDIPERQALNIEKAFILVLIMLLATMLLWEGCNSEESKYMYHPLLGYEFSENSKF